MKKKYSLVGGGGGGGGSLLGNVGPCRVSICHMFLSLSDRVERTDRALLAQTCSDVANWFVLIARPVYLYSWRAGL